MRHSVVGVCGWGGLPDVGALDLVVVAAVAVFWAFQEWWLHKFLLHAPFKVSVCLSACVRAMSGRKEDVLTGTPLAGKWTKHLSSAQ